MSFSGEKFVPCRKHHQRILNILESSNVQLLKENKAFFGGGTAISFLCNEFRESVDIDFLCPDLRGYANLRLTVTDGGVKSLFEIPEAVEARAKIDQYGIRIAFPINGNIIRCEFVSTNLLPCSYILIPGVPVPILAPESLFIAKLLANSDRYMDERSMYKDIIDLGALIRHKGEIPAASWDKAVEIYGEKGIWEPFVNAYKRLCNRPKLKKIATALSIEQNVLKDILKNLSFEIRRHEETAEEGAPICTPGY